MRALETLQPLEMTAPRGANALLQKDPRIVVIEHHRPPQNDWDEEREQECHDGRETKRGEEISKESLGLNSWVVNFNPFLPGALGCNTAVYYLGAMEQAKGAMYYMADYLVKSPTDLAALVSLALDAQKKISQFPSTTEDSGSSERATQRFFAKLLNSINGMQEISVQMAAAALLGCPGEIVSHVTEFVWIHAAVDFVLKKNCVGKR